MCHPGTIIFDVRPFSIDQMFREVSPSQPQKSLGFGRGPPLPAPYREFSLKSASHVGFRWLYFMYEEWGPCTSTGHFGLYQMS